MSDELREQVEVILSRYWGGDGTVRVAAATNSVVALLAAHQPEPLAIARFESRHGRIPPGAIEAETEWVMLRVDEGQENLHIDGEYAIYRRTAVVDQDHRVLAEATTEASNELWYAVGGKSYLPEQLLDAPPGTVVAVVTRDATEETR